MIDYFRNPITRSDTQIKPNQIGYAHVKQFKAHEDREGRMFLDNKLAFKNDKNGFQQTPLNPCIKLEVRKVDVGNFWFYLKFQIKSCNRIRYSFIGHLRRYW